MKLGDDAPVEEGEVPGSFPAGPSGAHTGHCQRNHAALQSNLADAVDDTEGADEITARRHRQISMPRWSSSLRLHREHRQLGDAPTANATDEFLTMFMAIRW